MRIDDLPADMQRQALAQLGAGHRDPVRAETQGAPPDRPQGILARRGPNKTEAAYRDRYLASLDARYEALTFRLACNHRFTPDWVVFEAGRPVECHECKGSYRHASHGRSRLAFDQAAVEFPGLRWVWNGEDYGGNHSPATKDECEQYAAALGAGMGQVSHQVLADILTDPKQTRPK